MKKFDNLLILGRPASGKSEFIDYMKKLSLEDRLAKLHIPEFEEIDDFPWIWEKFQDDDIWESMGHKRLYSFSDNKNPGLHEEGGALFDYCMGRFNIDIAKKYSPDFYENKTLFVEFARGGENAYENALGKLSKEILEKSAIIHVKVSCDESWRRNVARYEEKLKHSILAHMVPERTFNAFYKIDDWDQITNSNELGTLDVNGIKVPYVTMNNEPFLPAGAEIEARYQNALNKLWGIYE